MSSFKSRLSRPSAAGEKLESDVKKSFGNKFMSKLARPSVAIKSEDNPFGSGDKNDVEQ